MINYAVKNIVKRKSRSIILVIGIAVLVTLVIVITGIVTYQKRTMNAHASAGGPGRIIVQSFTAGNSYPASSIDMQEELADKIINIQGIQQNISSKVLFFELAPPPYPNNPPELLLTGISPGYEKSFLGSIVNDTRCISGTGKLNPNNAREAILGFKAWEYLHKKTNSIIKSGETISVLGSSLTVKGILEKSNDQTVNSSVLIPLSIAQNMLDKKGLVSSVILYAGRIDKKQSIINQINALQKKVTVITSETIARNASEGIKLFEQLINGITLVIIISSIILVSSIMSVTIKERTSELGVLRAIGASKNFIIGSVFAEIFIISLAGCILGSLASSFILRYGLVENIFDIRLINKSLPICLLLSTLSSVFPVYKITRIQPIDSLRYE
jgi:ABC-type antimicrobial peptide transport system permease subunit